MAKIPHRTFEIFDFLQEASDALASKSARVSSSALDADLSNLRQLEANVRPSGVVHVTFQQPPSTEPESMSGFGNDLADLAKLLTNGSRIMLDFEGVSRFESDAVSKLGDFQGKLKNKGSRVVLCNLEPAVRALFFPHLTPNASPSP